MPVSKLLEVQQEVGYCFRCGTTYPSSEFVRHKLTRDPAFILSSVCSRCYNKVKSKVAEHRSTANRYGGEKTLTVAEYLEILLKSEGRCFYCQKMIGYLNLIMEHKTPLSWKGGHTKENVVPACINCNSSKGDRDIETWQRHNTVKKLTAQLQSRLNLSRYEVVNLAIQRLALDLGLTVNDEMDGEA